MTWGVCVYIGATIKNNILISFLLAVPRGDCLMCQLLESKGTVGYINLVSIMVTAHFILLTRMKSNARFNPINTSARELQNYAQKAGGKRKQ